MTGSLLSLFGLRYLKKFYQFAASSQHEILIVERDGSDVVGMAILSTDPATILQRLMTSTPLVWYAVLSASRLPLLAILRQMFRPPPAVPEDALPELLVIAVVPERQSDGIGRRLTWRVEEEVAANGYQSYTVRTDAAPGNRALKFYHSLGFRDVGPFQYYGAPYLRLVKAFD